MKNTLKLLGLLALAAVIGFSITSCGSKGGTLTIVNSSTTEYILAYAGSRDNVSLAILDIAENPGSYRIEPGASKPFTITEDLTAYYYWWSPSTSGKTGTVDISGGNSKTVTVNTVNGEDEVN